MNPSTQNIKRVTPDLSACTASPLYCLESLLCNRMQEVCDWFSSEWKKTPAPIYGSVDLRNAGFKLAPIDMNLFPAGFNNLNPNLKEDVIRFAKQSILNHGKNINRILLIPESHTRNLFYWQNIFTLKNILSEAGFFIKLGWLGEEPQAPFDLHPTPDTVLHIHKIEKNQNQLHIGDFIPDLILLNNDLSSGIPECLENTSQFILPPVELGWSHRLKSNHFKHYEQVTKEFSQTFSFDAWWINPLYYHCGEIDFLHSEGMTCLIEKTTMLFREIQKKYDDYGITHKPFVIVKADAGTYGMAVMTVRDPQELIQLNRKQRTKMSASKSGKPVRNVIIQEGVYSFETFGETQSTAEPVVYLFGEQAVGGFYRVHDGKGSDESLNTQGMHFHPLPFALSCNQPDHPLEPDSCCNRFFVYGVVARLSMLAAAREMAAHT